MMDTEIDWPAVTRVLDADGFAVTPPLLDAGTCREVVGWFDDAARFRKTVDMAPVRFGRGVYRYFAAPLPALVAELRTSLYAQLAPVANAWSRRLGGPRYPRTLGGFLRRCHRAGQRKPTPLLLRYGPGDYNCLHQDRYGEIAFPLQVTILLSRPRRDFSGGEFLLVEQRPRMQSVGTALALEQGQAVIFANTQRPVQGARGPYRTQLRHGVSRVHDGERVALGLIFHDAQ